MKFATRTMTLFSDLVIFAASIPSFQSFAIAPADKTVSRIIILERLAEMAASAISEQTLNMWVNFPPNVRDDLCFKAFRDENSESEVVNVSHSLLIPTFVPDIESMTANHTLLDERPFSSEPKTHFNCRTVMHGIFFVLWLVSFWYYVTVRERVPQAEILSIDSTDAKCELPRQSR